MTTLYNLPVETSLENDDLFLVEVQVANGSNTYAESRSITANRLRKFARKDFSTGPYANDSFAAAFGVNVGEMYHDASGIVKVRLV